MRKGVLLVSIIILIIMIALISFISASYDCNGTLEEDIGEIDLYGKKSINGLGLGLFNSFETSVTNKFSADLLVDSAITSLSFDVLSEEIEIKKGIYNISILNLTGDTAKIGVGGSSGEIEKGNIETIGGLKVYLIDVDGEYPDSFDVDLILGDTSLSLSNYDNIDDLIQVEGVDYVLSLFSASDNNAIIKVDKCKNGIFTEAIVDSVVNVTDINISDTNVTDGNLTNNNVSEGNFSEIDSNVNFTEINQSNQNQDNQQSIIEKFKNLKLGLIFLIIGIFLVVFILFLYFKYKLKREGEFKELSNSYNSSRNN